MSELFPIFLTVLMIRIHRRPNQPSALRVGELVELVRPERTRLKYGV